MPSFYATGAYAAEAPAQAIRFGVSPWFSTNIHIQQHAITPIMDAVKASLAQPVEYRSAQDNVQFVRAAADGQYDVMLASAHVAALLVADYGFQPLLGYYVPGQFSIFTLKSSSITSLDALRGKRIGSPDEFSLATALAVEAFTKQGLLPGHVVMRYDRYDQLVLQLFRQDIDALVMNPAVFGLLEPATRDRLKQVYLSNASDLPLTTVYLLAPQVTQKAAVAIRQAVAGYFGNPEVRARFSREGRRVIDNVSTDDLKPLLHYAGNLRLRLKTSVAVDEAGKKPD